MKPSYFAIALSGVLAACSSATTTNTVPMVGAPDVARSGIRSIPVSVTAYPIPASGQFPSIVVGHDGALWFSSLGSNNVFRIEPPSASNRNPRVTQYDAGGSTGGMASGPDGNIWFSGIYPERIGRVQASAITYYPATVASTWSVALGPEKSALWLPSTFNGSNTIGRFALPTGARAPKFTTIAIPTIHSDPWGIVAGPDDAMWFTESSENRIGRIAPDGTITEFKLRKGPGPTAITVGPDKALWFTKHAWIGRISLTGKVSYFSIPPGVDLRAPYAITSGPDKALWWTSCHENGAIGRITTNGRVSIVAFNEGPHACPNGIVTGPDGALWVTMDHGAKSGYVFRLKIK